jgi:prepilin-type N-terminal cleavage/methylation domain-containing protein
MKSVFRTGRSSGAFSLIELTIVLAITAILASIAVNQITGATKRLKDGRRVTDLKALQTALLGFRVDTGDFPMATDYTASGGWETSLAPQFMSMLSTYIKPMARDPINNAPNNGASFWNFPSSQNHFYAYYYYNTTAWATSNGCGAPMVVIGGFLEGDPGPNNLDAYCGPIPKPANCINNWVPNVCRDWNAPISGGFNISIAVM